MNQQERLQDLTVTFEARAKTAVQAGGRGWQFTAAAYRAAAADLRNALGDERKAAERLYPRKP